MQKKEKEQSQVIEEIDREISDLVEEERPEAPEPAGGGKKQGVEKKQDDDRARKYLDDGIVINK